MGGASTFATILLVPLCKASSIKHSLNTGLKAKRKRKTSEMMFKDPWRYSTNLEENVPIVSLRFKDGLKQVSCLEIHGCLGPPCSRHLVTS